MYKPCFGYGFDFGSVLYFGLVYTFGNFGKAFEAKNTLTKLTFWIHFL